MKKLITFCSRLFLLLFFFISQNAFAQPNDMSVNQDVGGTYANTLMVRKGGAFQARFLENGSGTASGTRNWQFNSDGYNNSWGALASYTLSSYNSYIAPNINNASGNYVGGCGGGCYNANGKLPATQANYYYTYNIMRGNSYASRSISVLETSYNPISLTNVVPSNGALASKLVTITTSSTPNAAEYIMVRYSNNNFVNSTIIQATGSGTTWTANIPRQSGTINYYVYSTNKTKAQIDAQVALVGQDPHDTFMLDLRSNGGSNFSWTPPAGNFIVSSDTGTFATPLGYATLTATGDVFAALNAASAGTGAVSITQTASSTDETGAVSLNNSTNWTSVLLKPLGGGVKYITNAFTASSNLIVFNGADNVTIDGDFGGVKSISIENSKDSGSEISAIKFINDASNNVIQNCIITSAGVDVAYGTTIASANVLFGGTNGTTGNDNNTIANNDIKSYLADIQLYSSQLIASYGTASKLNSGNIISNNNLFDFFSVDGMAAINLGVNNDNWTITGNKIYSSIAGLDISPNSLKGIVIQGESGSYTINNNIIGYSDSDGTGMLDVNKGMFYGIDIAVGSAATEIQGNVINNILLENEDGSTFSGISVNSGLVNLGTTTGNTIGASTGVGSVSNGIYLSYKNNLAIVVGIYVNSSSNCTVANNKIGAIKINPLSVGTDTEVIMFGISLTGTASFNVIKNKIGGVTDNSISLGGSASDNTILFNGIRSTDANSATINIGGSSGNANTIENISFNTPGFINVYGIVAEGNPNELVISNNVLRKFYYETATILPLTFNFYGIRCIAIGLNTKINNNLFGDTNGNLLNTSNSNTLSGAFKGIFLSGNNSTFLEIKDNDFRGIVYAVGNYIEHNFIEIVGDDVNDITVSGNTFTDLKLNNSSDINFITINTDSTLAPYLLKIINNKIITGFEKQIASLNGIICISENNFSKVGAQIEINDNDFSNIKSASGNLGILHGIVSNSSTGLFPTKEINNNTFNNWETDSNEMIGIILNDIGGISTINNNTFSNLSNKTVAESKIYGISVGKGDLTTLSVIGNTISGFSSLSESMDCRTNGIFFY